MFPVTLGTESGHIQSHVLIIRLERYFALLFSRSHKLPPHISDPA